LISRCNGKASAAEVAEVAETIEGLRL